jgi:hypothetical protein
MEGEMALRTGDGGKPEAAFPVIELHNVFRRPQPTLVELVANNGLNAGVVLPPAAFVGTQVSARNTSTLAVYINGLLVGSGYLGRWRGVAKPLLNGWAVTCRNTTWR